VKEGICLKQIDFTCFRVYEVGQLGLECSRFAVLLVVRTAFIGCFGSCIWALLHGLFQGAARLEQAYDRLAAVSGIVLLLRYLCPYRVAYIFRVLALAAALLGFRRVASI